MTQLLAVMVFWLLAAVALAASGRSPAWARMATWCSLLLLPLPLLVVAVPAAKIMLAVLLVALLACAVDFTGRRRPSGFSGRFWYVLAAPLLIDATTLRPGTRQFEFGAFLQVVGGLGTCALALLVWAPAAEAPTIVRYVVHTVSAAAVMLALAELMSGMTRLLAAAAGVQFDPVHHAPYRSRTVSEFWNQRWNLFFGGWLRRQFFARSFAHAGPWRAVWITFGASAAFHGYIFLAIDAWSALSWASFFLLQPPLLWLERRFGVRRWPRPLGHCWTMTGLVVLSPLMTNPLLRQLGAVL